MVMQEKKGKVYLIGAGPGDVGLLTVKAVKLIELADVVVYDRLVSSSIMALISDTTEKINVGKNVGNHPVPQDRINEILLEQALLNKRVVRLKGGDSFLFGRGGEELELLAENNIDFEVVPGITSSISVPAYAGIPVTHRDFCSSLHIITGHAKKDGQLSIDFDALVRLNGTLIFMMSVSTIGDIAKGLLSANMGEDMPCAVIENGTYTNQRKFVSDLKHIAQVVKDQKVVSPAIIVVGKVCSLSDKFDWFSKLPLKGVNVLVTRPKNGAGKLSDSLTQLGAGVTQYPCIKTVPLQSCNIEINDYNVIVFTSAIGVSVFFDKLYSSGKDSRSLSSKKIAVVGSETGAKLKEYGITADFTPTVFDGKHLATEMIENEFISKSDKIVILRAKEGASDITDILTQNGVEYIDIPVYETQYVGNSDISLDEFDVVTFTSKSCVEGFVKSISHERMTQGISNIKAIAIGEQTAKACEQYGFNTIISDKATISSMIEKILEVCGNE